MTITRKAAAPLAGPRRTDVLQRLKTARGHVDGVLGMIEVNASCIDLLTQLSAIRSALNHVSQLIVQHHIERCFMELVRSGDEKTAIAELMSTLSYDPRT